MVCFIQHRYSFSREDKGKWFALLRKFLEGCKAEFTLNEGDVTYSIRGEISEETITRFNKMIDDNPLANEIVILTDRIWEGYAFINALPELSNGFIDSCYKSDRLDPKIMKLVLNVLKRRAGCPHDIVMMEYVDIPKEKVLAYAAWAIRQLGTNKLYYCPSIDYAFFLVDDWHICGIGTKYSGDKVTTISFDLDDGFIRGVMCNHVPDEFGIDFQHWKEGGMNPNKPVLLTRYVDSVSENMTNGEITFTWSIRQTEEEKE